MNGKVLGVDLGASTARAALVDRNTGEVIAAHKQLLSDRSPAAVVDVVAHALREVAGKDLESFDRIGVGVCGQCLGSTGSVILAPNLGWRDVPFGPMLSRAIGGARVRLANDLAAIAWGENRFGAGKGFSDVFVVFVGSGIGSGLVLGGRLNEGSGGVAGEFGHVKVQPIRPATRPRRCGCGAMSCLEAYTSGMNVAARVREDLDQGISSLVRELVGGDLSCINAGVVEAAYGRGDPYAREIWQEAGELLGTALANFVTVLNPARLILGGGVWLGCPLLATLVREAFEGKVSRSATLGFALENAFLGDEAGVIGAALLE
jgi:glucokinase